MCKMAAEKQNFSRTIFMHEDGRPISFSMRPCYERKQLKPIIEKGGGTISYRETKDCIKLLEPGSSIRSSDDYIKSQYVLDCVKANKLLEVSAYRCDTSGASNTSDDGMSPAAHIIRTTAVNIRGRQKYQPREDKKIVKYIVDELRSTEVHGKKLWNDMALFEITSHPAESMRTRYLKYILPNIKSYDFPKGWVAMLTGTTADAASMDGSDKTSTPSKRGRSSVSDEGGVEEQEEESQSILQSMRSPSAKHKSPRRLPTASPSKQERQSKSVLTRSSNSKSPPVKSPYFKDTPQDEMSLESASEDEFDKMLLETAGDTVRQSESVPSPSTSKTVDSPQRRTRKQSERVPSTGTSKTVDSPQRRTRKQSESEPSAGTRKTVDSPQRRTRRDRRGKLTHTQSKDAPDSQDSVDSDDPLKGREKSSKRREDSCKGREDRCNGKEASSKGREKSSERRDDSSKHRDDSSKHREDRCNGREDNAASMSSTPDSYDRHLIEMGNELMDAISNLSSMKDSQSPGSRTGSRTSSPRKTPEVNGSESDPEKTLNQGNLQHRTSKRKGAVNKKDTCTENVRKKPFSSSLLQFVVEDGDSFSQPSQGSGMSEVVWEDSEMEDTWEEDLQKLGEEFGLTLQEMVHVMYINTGSIDDGIHWIKFGWDTRGYPAWSTQDDDSLQGTDEECYVALELKHGLERLQARRHFLEGLL